MARALARSLAAAAAALGLLLTVSCGAARPPDPAPTLALPATATLPPPQVSRPPAAAPTVAAPTAAASTAGSPATPAATPSPDSGPFACSGASAPLDLRGDRTVWSPLALRFTGPAAAEAGSAPNSFLDYRLTVRFVAPSGRVYDVPGYFDGDGQGGGAGDQWVARFAADEPGEWRACASFRAGPGVAVDLEPLAGAPAAFDGATGTFTVGPAAPDAPGFYRWGRLEYAGGHYLKFRDGPYWIKGGSNSPENFLAYTGFQDTTDAGGNVSGFLHTYAAHVADWRDGDPTLPGAADEGKGIIGAINYLSDQGVNSLYFLVMNLGGDGGDTWPFLSPEDVTHYDTGKLEEWRVVFEHAQRRGVALQIVLNETEPDNRAWLDREPAAGGISLARRLYYRELVARFADLPAIKWNLSEENVFTRDEALAYAGYLQALDWADHPIAFHNPAGWTQPYAEVLGAPQFSATSTQYLADDAGALVEAWRAASAAAGRPWVIDMDENQPAQEGLTADNAGPLRKEILYDVLFSGGNIEWYAGYHDLPLGGDLNLEDFRTREAMWATMRYARRFLEENTPFWQMAPADALLLGEAQDYGGGEVYALPGRVYAIYLPLARDPASLIVPPGLYRLRWYDPRDGQFVGPVQTRYVPARLLPLGPPPYNPGGDWVMLVTAPD